MKKIFSILITFFLLSHAANAQNGYSTYSWPDSTRFEGHWKNGVIDGTGIVYWSDNHYYVGHWLNGKRWGHGVEIRPNGTYRLLYYEDDKEVKRTVDNPQTLDTGTGIYTGEMADGHACGKGTLRWNSGKHWFEGTWPADGTSRYGVLYNGDTQLPWQVETWIDGKLDGYGCIIEDGKATVGFWQEGTYLYSTRFVSTQNPNTKEELMKLIEETNKALPQSGGNGITLTKMYMDGGFVVNVNLVDEQTVTIAQIGSVKSIMKFP